ncbi:MAG: DEAD/DEAH box helicase [Acidimicrobiales bacterium]
MSARKAPKLRRYQVEAVDALRHAASHGARSAYLSLPAGVGKTRILAEVASKVLDRGKRVLWIVHRKELVEQAAGVLEAVSGAPVGVVMAERHEPAEPVVVGSVQTLSRGRLAEVLCQGQELGLVVIDECHHALRTNTYGSLVAAAREAFPDVLVFGATATPYRSDRHRMADLLPICAFERPIDEMVEGGFLVPMRWHLVDLDDLDLGKVRISRSGGERDFQALDIARACGSRAVVSDLVAETAPMLSERRSVVFGASVPHAKALARAYRKAGLRTGAVFGDMAPSDRTATLSAWRSGRLDLVANFGVLTEGYDLPELSAVVVARPTLSPGLYVQMIGRGLRPARGKVECLIIDTTGRGAPVNGRPVSLPEIIGERAEGHDATYGQGERRRRFIVDPSGRSRWAWGRDHETGAFVAGVGGNIRAVITPAHDASGLYAPLVTIPGRQPQLCSERLLPLREAVGALEVSLARAGSLHLARADMPWRDEEPTEKQLVLLARIDPPAAERAAAEEWGRGDVSTALDVAFARPSARALATGGAFSHLVAPLRAWAPPARRERIA